ncbi:cation diffusion facilitator family transporter [Phytoactinopolyspora alkaliphila]|uniref:cation diffusion facilitator family transporter n=1 Tax=Phytoactinopolyspora alkaliphila TaxID=1783498 RepID=UPI0031B624B4
MTPAPPIVSRRTAILRRRVRLIVAATITYNVIEAVIAIAAGTAASSAALVGFGLDSTVEVISAAAIAWQFSARDPESREPVALRIVACSFFALAAYVTFDAVRAFAGVSEPEHSSVGITLAAVSLVVMPALSWIERRTGRELGSASVVADSKQTLICAYLSGVVLAGLVVNSLLGWWWADPIAALAIAGFAIREGLEAWKGDACSVPASALLTSPEAETDRACGAGCADECCASHS